MGFGIQESGSRADLEGIFAVLVICSRVGGGVHGLGSKVEPKGASGTCWCGQTSCGLKFHDSKFEFRAQSALSTPE